MAELSILKINQISVKPRAGIIEANCCMEINAALATTYANF